jgi:RNA-directed DNA polymerase
MYRKVKELQRRIVRSLAARLLAVKRVTTNSGRNTPGVDGKTWKSQKDKLQATSMLKRPPHSRPLRRLYILKKNGKKRPLGIPTMMDRACQALHLLGLEPIAETSADPHSYGFRIGRGAADAIQRLHILLSKKGSAQWVMEGDIKSCFDEIRHQWLESNIPMNKTTLQQWLKTGYIEKGRLFPTTKGTPQGGIVSPTLANMTLDGLEHALHTQFGKPNSHRSKTNKVYFCRFADDWIITGSSEELLEGQVKPFVREFLNERGLELSEEKTAITHISQGFDFLGQNIRKYGQKLLIKPSINSFVHVKDKLRVAISRHMKQPGLMLQRVNLIIKGWCQYHRHVVSKKVFAKLDDFVFKTLLRWAKKQHPSKPHRWIINKYFRKVGDQSWLFTATLPNGKIISRHLAASTKIVRHLSIKGEANPFDDEWKAYFEERHTLKIARRERILLNSLWIYQGKRCKNCREGIKQLKDGRLNYPNDNIATDKETPFSRAKLVHRTCRSKSE